ncbi:MAG: tRNA (guanine37-N1)-methyltransferase [archaeon GW2011_AR3]|nr:MAG: tRNA (guanine37-N1)-methyltransferase [archaeon GW2011_AR3]MBS3109399.1 class I SAM-dependent methyltransferase family protein [Candidatus Woesearchaeota archaeon]
MKCIKVSMRYAEKLKGMLVRESILHREMKAVKEKGYVYFPLAGHMPGRVLMQKIKSGSLPAGAFRVVNRSIAAPRKSGAQKAAQAHLGGFDVVGDIAILEIPRHLVKQQKIIAKSILGNHRNIATVLKKKGGHEGTYRLQKMIYLAGKNKRETIHKEHGCSIKLDVERVYFSPRLSNERKRIFSQVRPNEKVLVMFSGGGAYPVTIARNSRASLIAGVEINPVGHKYALESVRLNKIKNVNLIRGDVRKEVPKLKEKFDRIVMPLPKSAENFLSFALARSKHGAIIHLYNFFDTSLGETEPTDALQAIKRAFAKARRKYKILKWVTCGQIAPRSYRICIDILVR